MKVHKLPFTCHLCREVLSHGVAVAVRHPTSIVGSVAITICAGCIGAAAVALLSNPRDDSAAARAKAATDQLALCRADLDPLRLENKELRAKLGLPSQHEEAQAKRRSERDDARADAQLDDD